MSQTLDLTAVCQLLQSLTILRWYYLTLSYIYSPWDTIHYPTVRRGSEEKKVRRDWTPAELPHCWRLLSRFWLISLHLWGHGDTWLPAALFYTDLFKTMRRSWLLCAIIIHIMSGAGRKGGGLGLGCSDSPIIKRPLADTRSSHKLFLVWYSPPTFHLALARSDLPEKSK